MRILVLLIVDMHRFCAAGMTFFPCMVADILGMFIADWLGYPLGLLFGCKSGVFLPYSSFKGASLEDFTLFDTEWVIFCPPEPTIVMGSGWKSNC